MSANTPQVSGRTPPSFKLSVSGLKSRAELKNGADPRAGALPRLKVRIDKDEAAINVDVRALVDEKVTHSDPHRFKLSKRAGSVINESLPRLGIGSVKHLNQIGKIRHARSPKACAA